ncbi:MAG TPA: amidohydrolase family protein [Chloroflexota bacterium]|nr:amidohydrolase family protein [Chloroflexota bacterium]
MNRLIIRPGAVIDGTGAPPVRGQAVVLSGREIEWVGRAAELGEADGAQVIDAPAATLLPGLIDCHVHLMCPATPCTPEEYLAASDEELLVRAVAKAQAALWAGVTTVRDLGSRRFLLRSLRDGIARGEVLGPRIVMAGPAITRTQGHFHYMGHEADTAEALRAAVRHVVDGGADVVKIMATGGRTTPGTDPEAPQFAAEDLRAAVDEAHGLGKRLTAHVHGVEGIRNAVAAGVDCLEHCSWVGPGDITAYEPALAERIVDQGMFVSPTFGARSRLTREELAREMPEPRLTPFWDRQETRLEATRHMIALGAKIVASDDAGMPNTHTHEFPLTLQVLATKLGMGPLGAIRAATSLAAEALGIQREVGAIAPGKRADLLLVDGDPAVDVRALTHVRSVIRDGVIVR